MDFQFKWKGPSICHVNANHDSKFKYVLEFSANHVEQIDLLAIFLGKVKTEFEEKGLDVLEELNSFVKNESGY